tara:strand:+ start:7469 stop:8305 length:837 start_codon:yes stop_codon:yes gene_type:complete
MKLLRYRYQNSIKPAIVDDENNIRDVSSIIEDWAGNTINDETINIVKNSDINKFSIIDKNVSIAPCIGNVGKFLCIGLNYSDHALETKMKIPSEPIIFMKATSSISGPNDDIVLPKNSKKTDWEAELGLIIGKEAKYITEEDAHNHIAGYCIINDVSEREFQMERMGQWVKGKSCDTFGPIGPYIVTKDEISNPQNLKILLKVNGKLMQNGSTATMVYNVNYLVSYVSQFMSLQPGDIISTGTPPGVGMGMNPEVYLSKGDTIEITIEGLGNQKQNII